MLEQHQREQTYRLGFTWHESVDHAHQPDRLITKFGAEQLPLGRGVPLIEYQVQDRLYAAESVGQKLWRRDAVRNAGVFDLALRAYQTLLHSWLGDQERASDLARRESADGAKRKCDSRFHRQRRMATR